MLYINNFYALFSSCSNQLFDITNKLSELISAFIHDTILCIYNQ